MRNVDMKVSERNSFVILKNSQREFPGNKEIARYLQIISNNVKYRHG